VIPDIVFLGIPPNDTLSAFTEVARFTRTPPKERLDGSGASRLIRAAAGTWASYDRHQFTPAERVP